jgi:hypothetical protein
MTLFGSHLAAALGLLLLAFITWKLMKRYWLSHPVRARWEEGLRGYAFGDVWDQMTPEERREAFAGDLLLVVYGTLIFLTWVDSIFARAGS